MSFDEYRHFSSYLRRQPFGQYVRALCEVGRDINVEVYAHHMIQSLSLLRPAWHNWLARETFTNYRDLKVESSSLSVGVLLLLFLVPVSPVLS
jgi:hypothetical protein